MTFLATSRWRYKHVSFLAYVCVLGGAQVQPMKFDEDRTMYAKVISEFVFCGEL